MNSTEASGTRGLGLSLHLDQAGRKLIARIEPSSSALPIDEEWLRQKIADDGFGGLNFLPQSVTPLLANFNAGMAFEIPVAELLDAVFRVEVSNDGLEACLEITPAQGGTTVNRDDVLSALAENGIGEGILYEAIEEALKAGSASHVVIARGIPAEHGKDGYFERLIPEVRDRSPRVDETGHVDFRNLGEIMVVHQGERLMYRHSPTSGTPGMTLLGERIDAVPGKEIMYATNLSGTECSPDDPNLLLAAITGQPVIVRGGMMVEPVYTVDDVSTASGNIDFDGSVVVRGDVGNGMSVKASGDIQVGGIVEMAELDAGNNIAVKGGVLGALGKKNVDTPLIKCGGCFSAAYAQQARIDAGDSIFIDDMAMQSELTAINHIRVGNKKRGHIVGGHVQATLSITAKVIGSPNRIRTQCEIGVNPLMHKHLLELCKTRDTKETQLLEVSKLLDFASKNPGKLKPEMIERARGTASALSSDIASLREEQEVMNAKIELSMQSRVTVEQAIHDGVEILMGAKQFRVHGEFGACAVGLVEAGLGLIADEAPPQR